MNHAEYIKSLELLEKLISYFISINEIELVEKVSRLVSNCDHNYYQTMLILANAQDPEMISNQDIINIRGRLVGRRQDNFSGEPI
jgi:hypothetical protein